MALWVVAWDVNTLAQLSADMSLVAGIYTETKKSTALSGWRFSAPADTDFSVTVSKIGYTTKTVTGKTITAIMSLDQIVDVYLTPPPAPTPPPSDESVIGSVGTSCDIVSKSIFGRTWFAYRNRYTGDHSSWDSDLDDAIYSAERNPGCFVVPEAPPAPEAPGNMVEAIGQKITAGTTATSNALTGVKNALDTKISDTLAGITNLTSIVSTILSKLDVLAPMKRWMDDFKFPNWTTTILQPIHIDLQPARDILQWTKEFKFPNLGVYVVQPINRYLDEKVSAMFGVPVEQPFWDALAAKIDVCISNKFGVDPALPFFDALWVKIKNNIDVWFSGKFGIDPKLPFWDELEKKIIALAVKIVYAAIDAGGLDPEYWKRKS